MIKSKYLRFNYISLMVMIAVNAGAALTQIEFSAAEGYANGNLSGSDEWFGAGSINTVDVSGTGTVTLDDNTADVKSVYKSGVSSVTAPFTISADFSFTEEAAAGSGDVMTLVVSKKNATALDMLASLQRDGADNYKLHLTNIGGSPLSSPSFPPPALGFDGTGTDFSDELSLSLSIQKGASASDWDVTMVLYNRSQSATVLTFEQTGVVTSVDFFNKSKLFGGFSSSTLEATSGTGNRILERFGIGNGEPDTDGSGGGSGPAISGWELFVTNFSLTGNMDADYDGDGQLDVVEFAHGGNPTNSVDRATLPSAIIGTNGAAYFASYEATNSNPGIPYIAEWTDNLTTGEWSKVWDVKTNTTSLLAGYDLVEREVHGDHSQLYYRTRLARTAGRPNILFIVADDLGYADVSFNNSHPAGPDMLTPELDNLATNGMIFTSAYVVHPFCGPSRMGLMAGRYPHEFGGPYNLPDSNTGYYVDQGMPTSETMFSTVLQDAGYFTGLMGKWHLGQQPEHHPNVRGFDEFWGFLGGGKYYNPATLKPQGPSGAIADYFTYPEHNGVEVEPTDWMTDWLTQQGTNFIATAATNSEPFFLYMSYNAPHTPLEAKPSDYQAVNAEVPSSVVDQRKKYLALVYALDRGVGHLVDALKATGQYDNTLIIFLSDNGGRKNFGSSNHPLRGWKDDVLEGGVRVPMFMHWPGVIATNTLYDHPVTALDLYPTFARLADADIPEDQNLDGLDIWNAVLAGVSPRPNSPIYSVRYQVGYGDDGITHVGIRQDNWKAVRWYGSWKLFDFDQPGHLAEPDAMDLSAVYPEVLSNLVAEAELWSQDHIRPLWFDKPYDGKDQEVLWDQRNMPHYDEVFTLP